MKVNKKIFTNIILGIIGGTIAACVNDKSMVVDQNSGGEKGNEEEELRAMMKEGKEKDVNALIKRQDFPVELLVEAGVLQWAIQNKFNLVVSALSRRKDFPVKLLINAGVPTVNDIDIVSDLFEKFSLPVHMDYPPFRGSDDFDCI